MQIFRCMGNARHDAATPMLTTIKKNPSRHKDNVSLMMILSELLMSKPATGYERKLVAQVNGVVT